MRREMASEVSAKDELLGRFRQEMNSIVAEIAALYEQVFNTRSFEVVIVVVAQELLLLYYYY